MTSLAVLITCHNRKANTLACLKALIDAAREARYVSLNVYVVDDGSTDGTTKEIRLEYPNVKVLQGNGSLYWGGGMNKAWKEAALGNYDFYMWLNDDTYLNVYAIKALLNDSANFDHRSILVGVCEWLDSSSISYSGYCLKNKVVLKPAGVPIRCDYFNGNVILVSKSIFSKVGFLDPIFTHTLGDTDYGLRAKSLGIMSYISSRIVAKCDGHRFLSPWCNPDLSLKARIKHFNSPVSKSPKKVFLFERRHTSLGMAIFRSSIIYVRLLFPKVWIFMGKQKLDG